VDVGAPDDLVEEAPSVLDARPRLQRGSSAPCRSSLGSSSNGRTFGPTATIMPSGRWSPETQSAVLERGLSVRERVPDLRLYQDVRRHIGVLTPPPKGWTGRRSDVLTQLLAEALEGSAAGSHIVQQGLQGETSDDEQAHPTDIHLQRRFSISESACGGDTEGLSPTAGAPGGLEQLAGAQGGLASEVRLPPS